MLSTAWSTEQKDGAVSDILVRAEVSPKENVWVGQRVILKVDVLAPEGWAQIKSVRDFAVDGAQVVRYESQGTRLNETIQGRAFSGQRYELSLFPRREGNLTVPPVPIEVEISRWGSEGGKKSERIQTPEVNFKVQSPPGVEDVHGLISTTNIKANQKWEPKQQKFKVNDTIKRIIDMSGQDISGMAFTPVRFKSSKMVKVYPAEPRVDDSYDRGTLSGKRVETATYVFVSEGKVELPKIIIPWWDLQNKKLQQAILPGLQLEIAPSSMSVDGRKGSVTAKEEQAGSLPRWLTIALIALLVLLALAVLYRQHIRSWWTGWQQARHEREDYYFRQFIKAAHSNNPHMAFNTLMHWLDRIHTGQGAARLDTFLDRYGDSKAMDEAILLEQALNKDKNDWSDNSLAKIMSTARHRWHKDLKQRKNELLTLPPLNP
ncbi:MAG: protein BatD [Planctomycetes bacterium]|nr:protein BatD [Planctomycetota bacterium]